MNTNTVLENLLSYARFPSVDDISDLVGHKVRLRISTDWRRDQYDIIGTTILSARIVLRESHGAEWLEITFPRQLLSREKESDGLELVSARLYNGVPTWTLLVRRTGWRGFRDKLRHVHGQVTYVPHSRFAAAA